MPPAPSPEPDLCLPGVCQRCGGVKATRALRLPKSPSAGFVDTPLRSRSPGGLDVPLPGTTARSPHRGPRGPGLGGGVPGREASVLLRGPFTWWRGVGLGASTRAGGGVTQRGGIAPLLSKPSL